MGKPLKEGAVFPSPSSASPSEQGESPNTVVAQAMPEYVQRYLNGESVQVLAAEHAVAPRTIYRWMMSELGDGYQQAVTDVLVSRIADADVALDAAADACQIARAREQARFARMDFERRRPHLYGQRPTQIAVSGNGVTVQLVTYAAPLQADSDESAIDGDSQRVDA